MCGIAGYVSFRDQAPIAAQDLETMVNTLVHRGPDESGMDIVDRVGMGMRRLSIIDLSGGRQPIWNEDKTLWTVFNGEIYNYRELRSMLQNKGHVFSTQTDTEVIVHAYEEYGTDFPRYLDGMFAIALHDRSKRKFFLVRDHAGIKPLYFDFSPKRLAFGSEIKAILACKDVKKELDLSSLNEFLTWEYVPGEHTLLKSIRKLPPASMLEIDLEHPMVSTREYWSIPEKDPSLENVSDDQWRERVGSVLDQTVKSQLVSDVPLGAFLSGGVDSSLVVSSMGNVKTFSIGFDDPTYNELRWAREVAQHLGVDHHDEVIQPRALELFHHLMQYLDDPIGDFSIFPTYLVSKLARKHVTVSLSGDGGDELFGGYETYLAQLKARQYAQLPNWMRKGVLEPVIHSLRPTSHKKGLINKAKRFVEGFDHDDQLAHARWRIFLGETTRNELFEPDTLALCDRPAGHHIHHLFEQSARRSPIDRSLFVDVKSYLCDNCLTKVDRMSMANSLESRVPFLSPSVIELAFQIPERLKIKNSETKVLLKQIAAQRVPPRCIYRPKEGFSVPIKHWLNQEFRSTMEALLDPVRIKQDGLFNAQRIEKLKEEHRKGVANHSHILWSLMVFHSWKETWLNHP